MPQPREGPKFLYALPPEDQPLDLPFTVEVMEPISAGRWRVLGRTSELIVAHAIFEAAAGENPSLSIVLRQGAAILRRSRA